MIDDTELLRRYAEEKSETAFAELVQRRLNFVYACALRRVGGNGSLAEDVTQRVFVALARGAAVLARRETLGGWLFTTTRFVSARVARTERRRAAHEQESRFMNESTPEPVAQADWEKLRPVLDGALDELNERDREAVLMRFFEQRSFAEVGEKLQLTENGARMRVGRALDKLHGLLARRGLTSTSVALGAALAGHGMAAPAGLAVAVTDAALAGGAAAAASGAASAAIGTFMSITKFQMAVASGLAVAGATGFGLQGRENAELRQDLASLHQDKAALAVLRAENMSLARTMAEVADLRRDDAEFERLNEEAAALQARSQGIVAAEKKRAAEWKPMFARGGIDLFQALDSTLPNQAPRVLTPISLAYPFGMQQPVAGDVLVDLIADADGNVATARVFQSSRREIEGIAVDAVSKMNFKTARKADGAAFTRMRVPVIFSMDNETKSPAAAVKTEP